MMVEGNHLSSHSGTVMHPRLRPPISPRTQSAVEHLQRPAAADRAGRRQRPHSVLALGTVLALLTSLLAAMASPAQADPTGTVRLTAQGSYFYIPSPDTTVTTNWNYNLTWQAQPAAGDPRLLDSSPAVVTGSFTQSEHRIATYISQAGTVTCHKLSTWSWSGSQAADPNMVIPPQVTAALTTGDNHSVSVRTQLRGVTERVQTWFTGPSPNPFPCGTSDDTIATGWHLSALATGLKLTAGTNGTASLTDSKTLPHGHGPGDQWMSAFTVLDGEAAGAVAPATMEVALTGTVDAPADSDGDGLSDDDETTVHGTNPNNADSDGGGDNDGGEVTAGTNPLQAGDDDADHDGLANDEETTAGTDPQDPDSDDDTVPDGDDACPTTAGAGTDGCTEEPAPPTCTVTDATAEDIGTVAVSSRRPKAALSRVHSQSIVCDDVVRGLLTAGFADTITKGSPRHGWDDQVEVAVDGSSFVEWANPNFPAPAQICVIDLWYLTTEQQNASTAPFVWNNNESNVEWTVLPTAFGVSTLRAAHCVDGGSFARLPERRQEKYVIDMTPIGALTGGGTEIDAVEHRQVAKIYMTAAEVAANTPSVMIEVGQKALLDD